MDKKAEQMTLSKIILIVLGIAVLIFLIYGFSYGWKNVYCDVVDCEPQFRIVERVCHDERIYLPEDAVILYGHATGNYETIFGINTTIDITDVEIRYFYYQEVCNETETESIEFREICNEDGACGGGVFYIYSDYGMTIEWLSHNCVFDTSNCNKYGKPDLSGISWCEDWEYYYYKCGNYRVEVIM